MRAIWTLLTTTWDESPEDDSPSMAVALAYCTTFSLAPLLALIVMRASLAWPPRKYRSR